jgi:endonuclease/exonuclease/phosphatase family metal-dependent hydrolase
VRLRVVTLNLWGDRAPLDARLAAAAAGLGALSPDVVLLQEVRVGDGLANTAVRLASLLGPPYTARYGTAVAGGPGTWGPASAAGEEGLAVIARHPLAEPQAVELPDARPGERRILFSARVDVAGARGPVFCHTTHLHWRFSDGVARERQVLAIDETIRAVAGDAVHVLGGDFNAAPDHDEIRFLRGRHTLGERRAYWQDAFAAIHPDAAGWTWARRNPSTQWMRWLELDRRIDYIFVSQEKRDGRARVLDSAVVLDAPGAGGVFPSDHFAVLADLEV